MAIEAVGLAKAYHGRKVVDDVSIEVKQGEVVDSWGQMEQARPLLLYDRRARAP